jgi:hypothetical protein
MSLLFVLSETNSLPLYTHLGCELGVEAVNGIRYEFAAPQRWPLWDPASTSFSQTLRPASCTNTFPATPPTFPAASLSLKEKATLVG